MSFHNKPKNLNDFTYNKNQYMNNENYNYGIEDQETQNLYNNSHILIQDQTDNDKVSYPKYYNNNSKTSHDKDTIESLKLKIMEKDKIIFEYMKADKESKRLISNLTQELSSKDEQNYMLNEEIKQLKENNNHLQELHSRNQIISYKSSINNEKEIINKLNNEKNELINEITKLKFIIQNHEDSIKKAVEEINNKEESINMLKEQLIKKNNYMNKNDDMQNNLRYENKQIPSLKRKINDLEQVIKMYQEQINDLYKNNQIINYNNINLEKKLNEKKEEIYTDIIKEVNNNQLNYKINNLIKELEDKKNENNKISEKIFILKNDNDAFIRLLLNELGNFMAFLEAVNIECKNEKIFQIPSINHWRFQSFEDTKLNESYSLKYDIMCSNMIKIKEKIISILNNGNDYWNKINKERIDTFTKDKKEFSNEKEELIKNYNIANNKIKEYEKLIEELNKDFENIQNNYIELQQNFKDFSSKNDYLENNYNNFVKQIENKLKDFPYVIPKEENNNNNSDLPPPQKILIQINSLINLCKELNTRLKDANKSNKNINKNKNDEIQILNNRINNLNKKLNDKEQIINKYKNNESNLIKINKQLENSLFTKENNYVNQNIGENIIDNKNKKILISNNNNNDNDIEKEVKLKKILDNFDIKRKINNYCSNILNDEILNYNYNDLNINC